MSPVGEWVAGMAGLTGAVLAWRRRHAGLDGQAIGPLQRIFRVNRAALGLWVAIATVYSAVVWGMLLVPVWYRPPVMALCLVSLLVAIPVWNRWLRRLERQRQGKGPA
jgi:hypothetical protein